MRVVCLQTRLVLFIQWIKTCWFGCQSYYHFGRVVYLAAQRQYRCTVFVFWKTISVPAIMFFLAYQCLFLAEFIANMFVGRVLYCNFVSAVQSVPLLNLTVSSMKFFSVFFFSYGCVDVAPETLVIHIWKVSKRVNCCNIHFSYLLDWTTVLCTCTRIGFLNALLQKCFYLINSVRQSGACPE